MSQSHRECQSLEKRHDSPTCPALRRAQLLPQGTLGNEPQRDRLAMRELIGGCLLQGMGDRVPGIEDRPRPGLALGSAVRQGQGYRIGAAFKPGQFRSALAMYFGVAPSQVLRTSRS